MLRLMVGLLVSGCVGLCQSAKPLKDALRAVTSVNVNAYTAESCGLLVPTTLLKQDVEVKLRIAGIKIADDIAPSQLIVTVNCAHLDANGERIVTAIYVSLALHQVVLVSRELKIAGVGAMWTEDNVWACGYRQKCDELVRNATRDFTDKFVNDYLEMNPKN